MTAFKKETVHNESAAQPTGSFAHILSSPLLVSIVIAVITLAVFIHVLSADFVMWDDDKAIYNNPNIRDLDLGRIFTDVDSTMRYNPLTLLGWCIIYYLFKLNPFWFHFSNWLLHGLNASLVFLVIRRFLVLVLSNRYKAYVNPLRVTIAAGLASLLWSVHPLRVEPVAWCTDLTYCQALFFLLLSLQFYLLANDLGMGMRRHYLLLATSVIFYMISLLSHALGMTFFLILPVIDICLFVKPGSGDDRPRISFPNRRMLLEKIPFAVAALAISLVTIGIRMASAGIWDKPVSLAEFGLFERFMQAMYI